MTTDKRDDQSHVIDCSDMMTTFLSKEGANSYPTSTVLLNRFFVSPDDYKWKENSGITIDMPKFKVGDDVHWYKLKDLYTNLKNAIISESIFKGIKIFKSETINPPSASNKAFATKNKYYILDQNAKQVHWTDAFDKTGFTHSTNPATDPIESIIDFVSVGSIDFMLCKHAVYAFENNTYTKVLDEQSANFNAFDATSNKLVIAADDGARVYSISGTTLSPVTTVTYTTVSVTVPNPDYKEGDSGSSGSSSSGSGSTVSPTITIQVTNGIPRNNRCTFVWIAGGRMYVGDASTSCNLPVDGPYTHEPTEEQKTNHDANPGKVISAVPNVHHYGVNSIDVPSGFEYGSTVISGLKNVKSVYKEDNLTYVSVGSEIKIYLNSDFSKPLTAFNSSNGISGAPDFITVKDGDVWVLENGKWLRTMNPEDVDITFSFILTHLVFEEDGDKDSIDCQLANVTVDELLSLAYSRTVFDKYFAKTTKSNTNFMLSFSKTDSKTVYGVYGDDDRSAKAKEMKDCCEAFDIG